jgi:hypothetical protein
MLTIDFKCLKGLAPLYLSSQFTFVHSIHAKSTRSQTTNSLYIVSRNNNAGKRTFHSRIAKTWNMLPVNIRCNYSTMSLAELKMPLL